MLKGESGDGRLRKEKWFWSKSCVGVVLGNNEIRGRVEDKVELWLENGV